MALMTPDSFLLEMYKDQCNFMRHHETQRSTVVNFIILIGGGLISVISDNGFSKSDLALSVLLIFIGLFGAIFSISNYERYYRNKEQARAYRNELDNMLSKQYPERKCVRYLKHEADVQTIASYPFLSKFKEADDFINFKLLTSVHALWVLLPLILAILGIIIIFLCFFEVGVNSTT